LTWCGGGCFDSRRRVNSTVGSLRMFAKARSAGGISVAHSASCGFTCQSKPSSRSERHNCAPCRFVANKSMSPLWGSGSDIATLPTPCAVGYKHIVGFANSSTVNSDKRGSNRALYLGRAIQQLVGRERRERLSQLA